MKKILLATTALVGFAGAAAAEVSLSGFAEIGVFGGDAVDTQFHSDLDVTFSLSGESDSGLSFGASIDLDEVGDDANATGGDPISNNGRGSGTEEHAVWVSGSFGKVTLGDTDGALDWAVSEIYSGSAINDDHSTHAGAYWNTGLDGTYDGQVMRYEYSFGDFGVAISAELDDTGTGDAVLGIGGKWSGDMGGTSVSAGLGYQSNGTLDVTAVSLGASMAGGFSANLGYARGDIFATGSGLAADNWWGLGVAYTSGALTVGANYGTFDLGAAGDQSGWGLVVNYDLGGGAVAQFGYGDGDAASSNGSGDQTWSAGLALSF